MRGANTQQSSMLSLMSPEDRVAADHPLRAIKKLAHKALARLWGGRLDVRWYGPSVDPAGRVVEGDAADGALHGAERAAVLRTAQPKRMLRELRSQSAGRQPWWYTLTYPVGWKLDEKDEDFDLDNYFSIDAPGNCHVSFFLYTYKMDEKTYLDTQNAKMKERVFKTDPAAVPFATWGTLAGSGVELRGKMKPVGKGRVRNFMHAEANRSVFVNEFCLDEDLPAAQAGFDLISKTFHFR